MTDEIADGCDLTGEVAGGCDATNEWSCDEINPGCGRRSGKQVGKACVGWCRKQLLVGVEAGQLPVEESQLSLRRLLLPTQLSEECHDAIQLLLQSLNLSVHGLAPGLVVHLGQG